MFAFYGLVSAQTGKAIDLFPDQETAQAMLAHCLADEPEWVDVLSVERIELEAAVVAELDRPGSRGSTRGRGLAA